METLPTMSAIHPIDTESIVVQPKIGTLPRCDSLGIDAATPRWAGGDDLEACMDDDEEMHALTRHARIMKMLTIGAILIFCAGIALVVWATTTSSADPSSSHDHHMHEHHE